MPFASKHRDLLIINGYVLLVLVLGALLSPALFFAAQAVMEASPDGWLAGLIEDKEFPSYFNRAVLLAALLGIFPLLKAMHMQWRDILGNVPFRSGWKHLLGSFSIAVISSGLLSALCWWADASRLKPVVPWGNLGSPLASGLAVSLLEEFLFRGAILSVFCRSLGLRSGLWWTTLVFAILHFLKPPLDGALPDDQVAWTSGFWVVTQLLRGFGNWQNVVAEFLLLAAVGWVLARARLDTGALWVSLGLHAGWVFGMKYFGQLATTTPALKRGLYEPWMVRNTCKAIVSPIVGIVPLLVVFLTGLLVLWLARRWHQGRQEPLLPQKSVASLNQ